MPAGRPEKSYKYGLIDVYTYRKLKSKLKRIKELQKVLIRDLKKDLENDVKEIVSTSNFIKNMEREIGSIS
jgi:hypothetical protein|tara:strand:+ start:102 stop:314 length:213 start_codon:yes stop_codon:yes gene_type:complete